ncbi:nucleotidyl transferase AbiEii/AbiGii toxin family protein [Kineosporia sp. J2-2]|uniref:Nucleotidyl transferase AbiEii/AbiGii toxin family protein n=1 Tax=Kineosporia corallincola TaxID=2835133 RepID=A0ABS5TS09_9ACTN|nr:nucleotidyl transferase AbiEii/AbiGii toxin family protein [Kineosporia corallincola]MBT0773584.1 nucleotidyl transferase AbiEii/AbiGii toxin family protein [Kineosporia corallincola]
MDDFHEHLARTALARIGRFGFAPAGGYAVQAHGFLERLSEDIDLFTTVDAEEHFDAAVAEAIGAYESVGLNVVIAIQQPGFARLVVTDPAGARSSKVELGVDWRAHPPATLDVGPVLHQDDAVANKVTALYSRAQTRDYIDVDAALTSGRYTGPELLALALEHDPGFEPKLFANALHAVRRLPAAEFAAYGLDEQATADLTSRLTTWAITITDP